MTRAWPLVLTSLTLLAGCGSDDSRPAGLPSTNSGTGGSGGTAGTGGTSADADVDAPPDGPTDTDASNDATADQSNPTIECVEDPIPTQGQNYCVSIDGDGYQCDPITALPCDVAGGETCDFDGQRFSCIPQDFALIGACGLCGDPNPDTCIPGFTCLGLGGKCTRYCCDSLQCALGEVCVMQPPTTLGICQATSDQVFAGFAGAPGPDGGDDADEPKPDSGPPDIHPECLVPAGAGSGSCVNMSSPDFQCNPVTNAGCDTSAGEGCEVVGNGTACVVGKHDGDVCDVCTPASCKPGSMCIPSNGCAKFCCSADECTPGICEPYPALGGLGLCVHVVDPDAGN